MSYARPRLTFWQVVNMNAGFFGIQFSFGLQQASMSPIYRYLGADEAHLPYLWLAGPMTGLLVQPLIGAMSDRTVTRWGRRTPYFLIGAIVCSLGLLAMPFSSALWMAAGLLWILDAANNVTMEPYRAFVGDKLDSSQHSLGFLTQSAFTGLAQTLAYLSPSLLFWAGMDKDAVNAHHIPYVVIIAFVIGAICSLGSILWTASTSPEIPLDALDLAEMRAKPAGLVANLREIADAIREMPSTMKQLALVKLFQWYAMFCYWQYIALALARSLYGTSDQSSSGFRDAGLLTGQLGAFYNAIAFVSAFALVYFAKRYGAKATHAACLLAGGIGMQWIPGLRDARLLFLPMTGIGLAWASMMGSPYIMLAGSIPARRTGVYMGIFNMFIVIPMIVQIFTLPLYYESWLGANPENVIRLAGALLVCAALATCFVRIKPQH